VGVRLVNADPSDTDPVFQLDGTTLAAAVTRSDDPQTRDIDEAGTYTIGNMKPGEYKVEFNLPADYRFTKKLPTGGDSLVDPATGKAVLEGAGVLTSGEAKTVNAGVYNVVGAKIRVDPTAPIDPTGVPTVDQKCSLLEAIMAANGNSAVDTCTAGKVNPRVDQIIFDAAGTINAPADGFRITSDMKIGGHAGGTTISGQGVAATKGVFSVNVGSGTAPADPDVRHVTLEDLSIVGVETSDTGARTSTSSSVAVKLVGQGAYDPNYALNLKNLLLRGNLAGLDSSSLQVTRPGRVRVIDSVIEENSGGINLDFCDVTRQISAGLEVVNSIIRDNDPYVSGSWGGGIVVKCGDLEVVDSVILENESAHEGAGIRLVHTRGFDIDVGLVNSTVTDNSVASGGSGVDVEMESVGSERAATARMRVAHSTIAGNAGGSPTSGFKVGAGVNLTVQNSVVADNDGSQCSFASALPAVPRPPAAAHERNRGNAASDDTCGFGTVGSVDEIDLKAPADNLKAPADNGNSKRIGPNQGMGPVKTMAFGGDSPLLDGANGAACRDVPKAGESKDARGVARPQPQGGACDIGAYEAHVISGTVYDDVSDEGFRAAEGEDGIDGVKVELVKPAATPGGDETVVTMATTRNGGVYRLPAAPGTWTVRVKAVADNPVLTGRKATTATSTPNVEVSASDDDEVPGGDFGYLGAASISGTVWLDANDDGEKQSDESDVVERVVVKLVRSGGDDATRVDRADGVRATDTTGPDGQYRLPGLLPGTYQVEFTLPDGYRFTAGTAGRDSDVDSSGRTGDVVLASGEAETGWDAGAFKLASISGMVWVDDNGDGVRHLGDDSPLEGATVSLLDSNLDPVQVGGRELTEDPGPDGQYDFPDLDIDRATTYHVRFTLPEGYRFTEKKATGGNSVVARSDVDPSGRTATVEVVLDPGEDEEGFDAGAYLPASVTGMVWVDDDADGTKGDGVDGAGVAGVGVRLVNADPSDTDPVFQLDGTTLAAAVTRSDDPQTRNIDEAGTYTIGNMKPGSYRVEFTKAGHRFSDPAGGTTSVEELTSGDPTTVDAGAYLPASISGMVWVDKNDDGRKVGEDGLGGVTVRVFRSGATTHVKETTTRTTADASADNPVGTYSLGGLKPGRYEVEFTTLPAGIRLRAKGGDSDADPSTRRAVLAEALTSGEHEENVDAAALAGQTIVVNSPDGGVAKDGKCTLEEALISANTNRAPVAAGGEDVDDCKIGWGDDRIEIMVPGPIPAPSGGFGVESNVAIKGRDSGAGTVINGEGVTQEERAAFVFASGDEDLTEATLEDLKIVGVPAPATRPDRHEGRGVRIADSSTGGVTKPYEITLRNLHLESNDGGVYYANGAQSARPGSVRIVDSVVEGSGRGGGVVASCDSGDSAAVMSLRVTNSTIRRNVHGGSGGGIRSSGCSRLWVVDSTITGNRATGTGEGQGGGGVYLAGGTQAELINTTVENNTAVGGGGGIRFDDAGSASSLTIVHGTIAGNRVDLGDASPAANGVHADAEVSATIRNTVIAGNGRDQCGFGGATVTQSGNASSDATCGFGPGRDGIEDARLAPLADNGGAHRTGPNGSLGNIHTMAVKSASPLLGAGDAGACQAKDARGVARPQDSACDVGAYEADELTIGDFVWEDRDSDGDQDDGEPGLEGVTLALVDSDGDEQGTDTTDENGGYSFKVTAGEWTVRVTDTAGVLSGHQAPAETSKTVDVAADGDGNLGFDFGYRPLFIIGDLVWEDRDGDGDQDDGERGLGGVTLALVDSDGDPQGTDTTDENGGYSFKVTAGEWTVQVTDTAGVLSGHQASAETSKTVNVAADGDGNLSFDFGYQPPAPTPPPPKPEPPTPPPAPSGSIGDLVWVDVDHDGVKDSGEPGLEGVKVSLLRGESEVGSTSSDASGGYSFKGLAAGDYVVVFTAPAGYVFTSRDSGDDDGLDSDADSSGRTETISLAAGEADSSWDAGLRRIRVDGPPRYAGADRYGTSVEISRRTFPPGVDAAYVATGVNFPDALAGSAASGGRGPILLVTKTAIPGAVITELKRLSPRRIVVLGGTGVVSAEVEAALRKQATTARQAGADRYTTAVDVSAKHFEKPGVPVAYVATGEDFPDALTGGPAAAKLGGPILLTRKDKLPSATVSELRRLKPERIVVLGGTGVISEAVQSALAAHTSGEVTRLAGADRYQTGAAISKAVFDPGVPMVFIATGVNFPDALAGGAAAAFEDGPVLLVAGGTIPKATKDELTRLQPKRIVVLGGPAAVPESVEKALNAYIR